MKNTPKATFPTALLATGLLLFAATPALASPAVATGAGGGAFAEGTAYDGVLLSALRFALGLEIASDGSAAGDVQLTLLAAALPGLPARITIDGQPTSASLGSAGQATVSGLATVTVAGTPPVHDVPFTLAIGRTAAGLATVAAAIRTIQLPAVEISEGRVTIN